MIRGVTFAFKRGRLRAFHGEEKIQQSHRAQRTVCQRARC
jgi:hypothetical protein